MKVFYEALLDVYEEMEELMTKEGKPYRVQYAKEAVNFLMHTYISFITIFMAEYHSILGPQIDMNFYFIYSFT